MTLRTLTALMVACLLSGAAHAGARLDGCPKDAPVVGTVCARLGNCAVVALAKGASVQAGERLLVGRPTLLVTLAKGKGKLEVWSKWQMAGHVQARLIQGTRVCIAFVVQETPRTGANGKPAPNIRPGDRVCRAPGGAAVSTPKSATPPGR